VAKQAKENKVHPWDRARRRKIKRRGNNSSQWPEQVIDRGANYFVLQLERLGARTLFSCEGHHQDFYITFESPYVVAWRVQQAGYFTVEISNISRWVMRANYTVKSLRDRNETLRMAANAWEKAFGPLFGSPKSAPPDLHPALVEVFCGVSQFPVQEGPPSLGAQYSASLLATPVKSPAQ
jgi:hypothetical protein